VRLSTPNKVYDDDDDDDEILGQTDCIGAKSPIFYLFLPVAPQP